GRAGGVAGGVAEAAWADRGCGGAGGSWMGSTVRSIVPGAVSPRTAPADAASAPISARAMKRRGQVVFMVAVPDHEAAPGVNWTKGQCGRLVCHLPGLHAKPSRPDVAAPLDDQ